MGIERGQEKKRNHFFLLPSPLLSSFNPLNISSSFSPSPPILSVSCTWHCPLLLATTCTDPSSHLSTSHSLMYPFVHAPHDNVHHALKHHPSYIIHHHSLSISIKWCLHCWQFRILCTRNHPAVIGTELHCLNPQPDSDPDFGRVDRSTPLWRYPR